LLFENRNFSIDYWLDYRGIVVRFPVRMINVLFSAKSRLALRPTNKYREIKRLRYEGDKSPLFSAAVKNGVAIPPLPYTSLWHVTRLNRDSDKFAFTLP
jgi:hypothetical protein